MRLASSRKIAWSPPVRMGRLGKRKRLKKRKALVAMVSQKVVKRRNANGFGNGVSGKGRKFKGEVAAGRADAFGRSERVELGTGAPWHG